MSLARYLFNEFQPFSWDPFNGDPSLQQYHHRARHGQGQRGSDFWQTLRSPAMNMHEEEGTCVIEAEVPGVKKENLNLRIGDGGRSLTIEGRSTNRFSSSSGSQSPSAGITSPSAKSPPTEGQTATTASGGPTQPASNEQNTTTDVATTEELSTNVGAGNEQSQVGQYYSQSSNTFTRTIWLPYTIDPASIKAKLEDGILIVRAPKANNQSVNIAIE